VRVFLAERRTGWAARTRLVADPPEPAAPDVFDDADRVTVRAALATVPPRQRAALVLRYYCDLSVEQAAEVMRCSTGNVKSQTARGQLPPGGSMTIFRSLRLNPAWAG